MAMRVEKGNQAEVCREKVEMIQLLAGIAKIDFVESKPESSIGTVGKGFESFILVDENINKEQLVTRFQKTLEKEEGYARMSENKLNGNFAQHAPENLIQEERDRLAESQRKIETLKGYLKELM
jgi:valyl-tRNA synthetase